jgi:hypothetical protein
LSDFDDTEYGICDRRLRPREAYWVFRDYPKDWSELSRYRQAGSAEGKPLLRDGFEGERLRWTAYGDGMSVRESGNLGVTAEQGRKLFATGGSDAPVSGGVWLSVRTRRNSSLRLEARVFTEQHGSRAENSRCRVGIDPTGATDPKGSTVVWSRWISTSGEWDTAGVGQGDPVTSASDRVTLFLEYAQTGGRLGQVSAFDSVRLLAPTNKEEF